MRESRCDVCWQKTERLTSFAAKAAYATTARLVPAEGEIEVCPDCENRIVKPLRQRHRAEILEALQKARQARSA